MTDPTPPAACLPGLRGGVVPCQSMSARRGVQRALGKEGASFFGPGERKRLCGGGGGSLIQLARRQGRGKSGLSWPLKKVGGRKGRAGGSIRIGRRALVNRLGKGGWGSSNRLPGGGVVKRALESASATRRRREKESDFACSRAPPSSLSLSLQSPEPSQRGSVRSQRSSVFASGRETGSLRRGRLIRRQSCPPPLTAAAALPSRLCVRCPFGSRNKCGV